MSRFRIRVTAGAALAIGAALLYPGTPGSAASGSAPLAGSTWFWQGAVAAPVPSSDPSVPSGDLAVAGPDVNSQPEAETYLSFDLSAVPAGSTVTSFVVELPADPKASQFTPSGVAAPIVACAPEGSWKARPGPQPFSAKPAESCAPDAPRLLSTSGGKAYKVDVATIAQQWVSLRQPTGDLAVTDDPQNSTTAYQVVFGPADALAHLQATVTYSPPPPAPNAGGVAVPTTVPPTTEATVPVTVAVQPNPLPNQPVPVATVPSPPTSAPPPPGIAKLPSGSPSKSAGGPAPTTRIQPAATAGSAPPAGFWIAGLLIVAVLALCGVELGRTPAPAEVERRR
ncbi:MAG TPA: hypothetical protein VKI19_13195, partial [Acidimicrobiales bacterium]|nr:hypothetical protein [Acidimicrobiales bacterium]